MKYEVVSICIASAGQGVILKPNAPNFDSEGRAHEIIDTETNTLFKDCKGPWDVEDAYEAFWNRLNDFWERDFPATKERVKVLYVKELVEPV